MTGRKYPYNGSLRRVISLSVRLRRVSEEDYKSYISLVLSASSLYPHLWPTCPNLHVKSKNTGQYRVVSGQKRGVIGRPSGNRGGGWGMPPEN